MPQLLQHAQPVPRTWKPWGFHSANRCSADFLRQRPLPLPRPCRRHSPRSGRGLRWFRCEDYASGHHAQGVWAGAIQSEAVPSRDLPSRNPPEGPRSHGKIDRNLFSGLFFVAASRLAQITTSLPNWKERARKSRENAKGAPDPVVRRPLYACSVAVRRLAWKPRSGAGPGPWRS